MQDGITLITPTGDRPDAFALCERWMSRQTRSPDQWIVVDDGRVPTRCSLGQQYVRRAEPPSRMPGLNRSLLTAAERVRFDKVLVIEDDDWYAADYVSEMERRLERHDLVGEGRSRYYNVLVRRFSICRNERHASLCQTGFRTSALTQLEAACRADDPFVDVRFWRTAADKRVFFDRGLCVGIKGLPGRGGYGIGHRPTRGFTDDVALERLREWIGDDADLYAPFGERYATATQRLVPWGEWIGRRAVSPWLVIGKGPSFDLGPVADSSTCTLGLNDVLRERSVDVAHVVDLDVIDRVPDDVWRTRCGVLVMPWHPHVENRAGAATLAKHVCDVPILWELAEQGRLLVYHARTGEPFCDRPDDAPCVPLTYFGSEAAIGLLGLGGVKTVRTLSIDGGSDYATAFEDLVPLTNGRPSFDDQFRELDRLARRYGMSIAPLTGAGT